ncbi:zinc finger matrin-type protein 5 isoform 7-T8 [Podargus strigoides]
MSDSPQFTVRTATVLTGVALVPGSGWLELSPVRRPSIGWQGDSGGGGAATGKLQGELRSKELWQEGADVPPGTIEDWLEKRAKRLSMAQSNRKRSVSVRVSVRFCRSCRGAHLLIAIPKGSEASKALRYHRFHECGNGKRRGIPLMPLERKHS